MATTTAAIPASSTAVSPAAVPWYIAVGVLGVTSSSFGTYWDISWHTSIGRDSFWTPAHVAIYMCGVLAGIVCGYLILATTFGRRPALREASISVLGLRAPLGAFVAAWGGLAMLTAAPFDNWWHEAYGLDVALISPPHTLIYIGMRSVTLGMLLLTLAAMNRAGARAADTAEFRSLRLLVLYVGGLLVSDQMLLLAPYTYRYYLHGTHSYRLVVAMILPVLLLLRQIARHRWAATVTAGVYTVGQLLLLYILPLFPAHPRLGPVYTSISHMVPPSFPLLLLVPAAAVDMLWQRAAHWRTPLLALASSAGFTAALVAAEWPFASFLLSPYAANRVFGTLYFPFSAQASDRLQIFHDPVHGALLWVGLLKTVLLGTVLGWAACSFGRWMQGVQR